MKSGNDVDKYAMAVMQKDSVVGHLWEEKNEKFAKAVFFFVTADATNSPKMTIKEKAVNKRKGMGM